MDNSLFLIREIEPRDNEIIEGLIYDVFKEFKLPMVGSSIEDEDVLNMHEAYQDKNAVYYVIEVDGEVLGGGGVKQLKGASSDVCELQKMYFSSKIRGKGYGKIMFDKCMDSAKELGFKQCYLESASQLEAAIHIYKKNGFKVLDKAMGETGHYICGVWMLKDLV